jgi:hypothetical protein
MDLKDISTQDLQYEINERRKPKLQKRNVRLLTHYDDSSIEGTIELYSDMKWPEQLVYNNKVYNWGSSIKGPGSFGEYYDAYVPIVTVKD